MCIVCSLYSIAPVANAPTPLTGFTESSPPKYTLPDDNNDHTDSGQTCISEGRGHKTTPLAEWGVEEVAEWLREIGLAEYIESFTDNEIVGEHLVELSKEELKELGIKKIGHQKKFHSKLSSVPK